MTISIARMFRLLLVIFAILLVDFVTKYIVHHGVPITMWSAPVYPYGGIPVFQNFLGIDLSINHVTNRGGPWGVVSSHHTSLLILRIFAIFCISIHLLFFNQIKFREIPLCMIIGGALGNVLDSFFYGHVIDMIQFVFWGHPFAVFNVADACISIGVGLMLVQACLHKWLSNRRQKLQTHQFDTTDSYPLDKISSHDNHPY